MYYVFFFYQKNIYIFLIWSIFRSFLNFFFDSFDDELYWTQIPFIFFPIFIGYFWWFIYSCIHFQMEKLIFQKRDTFLNSYEAELKKKAIYWFHWKNVQFIATSFAMNSLFCSKVIMFIFSTRISKAREII